MKKVTVMRRWVPMVKMPGHQILSIVDERERPFVMVQGKPKRGQYSFNPVSGRLTFSNRDAGNHFIVRYLVPGRETFSVTPAGRKALAAAKGGK